MNETSSFSSFSDDYKQIYFDFMSQDEEKRRNAFEFINQLPKTPEIINQLLEFIYFTSEDQMYNKNMPCIESFTIDKLTSIIGNIPNQNNENDEYFSTLFQHIFQSVVEMQPKNIKKLFSLLNLIATKYDSSSDISAAFASCTEWFTADMSFNQIEITIRTFFICAFLSSNKGIEISLEYSDYLNIYRAAIDQIKANEDNYLLRLLLKLLDKYIGFFFIDFIKDPEPMEMIYLILESYTPEILNKQSSEKSNDDGEMNDEFELIDKQYSHLLYQCTLFCLDLFDMEKMQHIQSQFKIAYTSFYSMFYMRIKQVITKILVSNNSIFLKNDIWFKTGILLIKLYDYTIELDQYIPYLLKRCEQNAQTDEYYIFESFDPTEKNEKEKLAKELYYFVLSNDKDPKTYLENNLCNNKREICTLIFQMMSTLSPKPCLDFILEGESEQLLIFGAAFVDTILKLKLNEFSYHDIYVAPLISICSSKLDNIYDEASRMVLFMKMRELSTNENNLFDYLSQIIESNDNGLLLYIATDFMDIFLNENPDFKIRFNISSLLPKYDEINPISFFHLIETYMQQFTSANSEEITSFLISKMQDDLYLTELCKTLCLLTIRFNLQHLIMPIYENSFSNPKAMRYLLVSLLNSPFFVEAFEKSINFHSVLSFSLLDVFDTFKTNEDLIHMIYQKFISPYIVNKIKEIQRDGFCWPFITLLCCYISNHFIGQNDLDYILDLFIDNENNNAKYLYQIVMISSMSISKLYSINEYFVQKIKQFAISTKIEIYSNFYDYLVKTLQIIDYSTEYDEDPSLYLENINKTDRNIQPYEDENDKEEFLQCLQYQLE